MMRAALLLLASALALPLHAQLPVKSYGQDLVDQVVARNPGLLVIVLHVSPPNVPNYPIIASNIGRIGKIADDDDMRVINSGETIVGVYGEGKRYGVELPLRDAANKTIGALSLGFRYNSGDDEKAFLARAEKVRDELQKRIPSVESLAELDP